jgi:hypothetical protein
MTTGVRSGIVLINRQLHLKNKKTACRIFCQVAKNQGLDIVEGSALSETEEEPTHSFSVRKAGKVGVPATQDSFAPTV